MQQVHRDEEWVLREYGAEKWPAVLAAIRSLKASGERDLGRVLWSVMRSWRGRSVWEESPCVLAGSVRDVPLGIGWEARQGIVPEALSECVREDTSLVVELGSGWGFNLLQFWCRGGPRNARYVAAEYTAAGRECSRELADLDAELSFSAVPFDYHAVRETPIERAGGHALVFSCQSIEQIPDLRADVIEYVLSLGSRVTCLHFEPCGWQVRDSGEDSAARHREYAERNDYNRNLWRLLRAMEDRGAIDVTRVVPLSLIHI